MIETAKVVTAEEMARVEKGGDHESFMREAGCQIGKMALAYMKRHHLPPKITLLVGKGNNGGDAYAAGIYLREQGVDVNAFALDAKGSDLNQLFRRRFEEKGGRLDRKMEGVLLDGLLGTGFRGNLEPSIAAVIRQANRSGNPILSIDLPSGLHGTTGEIQGEVIQAKETIALGLVKIGCFLQDGWNCVGKLRRVDFGLSKEAIERAKAVAFLPKSISLPPLVRNRHKYQAGYIVGFGGSREFSGALKLAGWAALKAGAGLVRLFSSEEIGPAPWELIVNRWTAKGWKQALQKAQAVFVGPGLGFSTQKVFWLKRYLKEIEQPCVIDADALQANITYPKHSIFTPHRGEALRLLNLKEVNQADLFAQIQSFCGKRGCVLVLKGAPTFIFSSEMAPLIVPRGDPGMATAGSGDVLTGIIGAFLAQGCSLLEGATLGALLHAIAGEKGAIEKTSYCLTATDLIDFMPDAFRALRDAGDTL